jgi:hypothetical protein
VIRVRLGKQTGAANIALLVASLLTFVAVVPASAAPPERFIHVAKPGDTLEDLAANYLGDPALWPILGKLNRIADPRKIPVGFEIAIPVDSMRSQPERARVLRVDGVASVVRTGSRAASPLGIDSPLFEGDVVRVPENSFVVIVLGDGSIVHVQSDTVLHMGSLRKLSATGASRAIFRLEKGRVDAVVQPVSSGGGRFDVATPLAVAGVRGTNFGVGLRADGSTQLDVIDGVVAFGTSESPNDAHVGAQMNAVMTKAESAPTVRPDSPGPRIEDIPAQVERPVIVLELPGVPVGADVRVQISRDARMRDVVLSRITKTKSVQLSGLADGEYFLGVQAADAEGNMSKQSATPVRLWLRPQPPIPLTPALSSTVSGAGLVLGCSKVEEATVYDLQLSDSAGFEHLIAQSLGSVACRWELPTLPRGKYYWRATTVVRNSLGEMVRGPRGDAGDFVVSDR